MWLPPSSDANAPVVWQRFRPTVAKMRVALVCFVALQCLPGIKVAEAQKVTPEVLWESGMSRESNATRADAAYNATFAEGRYKEHITTIISGGAAASRRLLGGVNFDFAVKAGLLIFRDALLRI